MFLHSSSKNHRSKGSNVKKILQWMVVLAVVCWLIYQVKHSHEKKNEFVRNHESKPSKGGEEIYLGRKGDAGSENVVIIDPSAQGSENVVIIDPSAQGSDESSEMKKDPVQHDSTDLKGIGNSKDALLLKDSQVSNSNNGEKESTQKEHTDSYTNDGEETLRLPTESERANSSNKDKNNSNGGRNPEEREHLDDGENGDTKRDLVVGEASSAYTIESSENGKKQDEHQNKIEASNQDVSATDETLKEEGADTVDENRVSVFETSDIKIDSASKNGMTDDVLRHSKDSNDFNNGEVSHEAAEENAFQNDNEASKEGKVDSVDATLEKTKIDGKSEKEIENSLSEEKDAWSVVPVDSQSEKYSRTEGTENVMDDQETSSEADDHSKGVKVEMDFQRGDSDETGNSESNSFKEIEKSSEVIEQSGSNDLEKEIAAGDVGESLEHHNENFKRNYDDMTADSANESGAAGYEDRAANEEGKNEKINSVYLTNEILEGKPEAEMKTEEDAANASVEGEASEEKAVQ